MPTAVNSLTLQLLEWLAVRPRTYAETMDAWRTTCPRLTVWEDALAAGLVQVEPRTSSRAAGVNLTAAGRELLHAPGSVHL